MHKIIKKVKVHVSGETQQENLLSDALSDAGNTKDVSDAKIPDYNQKCILYYPSIMEDNRVLERQEISRHSALKNVDEEDISNRFILLRSRSIAHWQKRSFAWDDQEIELELEYLTIGFLIPRKGQDKGRYEYDVEIKVIPGNIEMALREWAIENNRDREDISDIVFKKASYNHSIYGDEIVFELAGFLIADLSLNPMKGCRCIRTGNKRVELFFDISYFGKTNLRYLYTSTDDNVIVRLQKMHLQNMPLKSTQEFGLNIPNTLKHSFLLHLHNYQRHALCWMLKMEYSVSEGFPKEWWLDFFEFVRVPRFSPSHLVSFYTGNVSGNFPVIPSFFPKGGILTSESGFGKTIIALALIASKPPPDLAILNSRIPFEKERNISLASKATLIIVPTHLINQWHDEIKKCFFGTKTVVKINNHKDYTNTSWSQVINADIVLLSKQFYFGSYATYICDFREPNELIEYMRSILSDPTLQLQSKGIHLKAIYFHRVIVDEFYDDMDPKLFDIRGDYMWGLTTQQEWTVNDIDFVAKFLQPFTSFFFKSSLELPLNASYRLVRYNCFKTHFIKSNTGFLEQPDVSEERILVQWSNDTILEPVGKQLLDAHEAAQILFLSLNEAIVDLIHIISLDIQKMDILTRFFADVDLQSVPEGAGAYIENILVRLNDEIKSARRKFTPIPASELKNIGKSEVKKMIENHYAIVKNKESDSLMRKLDNEKKKLLSLMQLTSFKRLRAKENEKNRLIQQMSDILNEEATVCLVCRDSLADCKLIITDCFHVYDYDCFSTLVAKKLPCPSCRCNISLKRAVEFSKVGSLGSPCDISTMIPEQRRIILSIVKKLKSVLVSQYAKIILFVDDSNLASLLFSITTTIGIQSAKFPRESSIWQYQKGITQLLILTPEHDFSGLNLCISTHIFFVEGSENHKDIEKLLISRASKSGFKNQLTLVRFQR